MELYKYTRSVAALTVRFGKAETITLYDSYDDSVAPVRLDVRGALAEYIKISIHALREEGDSGSIDVGGMNEISIHALREEGDLVELLLVHLAEISIHALREEGDRRGWKQPQRGAISIHALREEGDG